MAGKAKGATESERLYLIDTSGFIFRAYHALPALTTSAGVPTGAVYGFCNMLLKLVDEHQPDYLAAVLDSGKPSFRLQLFEQYKANRPPAPEELKAQFPLVKQLLAAFRVPAVQLDGFEADDVIATLTTRARDAGLQVTIVSSDKDLMQLAGDRVTLLDTMKDRRFGPPEVAEKFGVGPEQLGDWLALVGDHSDNVPGVPGVGPKTATKLLHQHGTLEEVLAHADQVSGKKLKQKLVEHAEQARLSRRLVELVRDCPVPAELSELRRAEPDRAALWQLFGELEFGRLRPRVAPGKVLDPGDVEVVTSAERLQQIADEIADAPALALHLETTSRHPVSAAIIGLALRWGEGRACYVPVSHLYLGAPRQLPLTQVLETLRPLLAAPRPPKSVHDGKLVRGVLAAAGVEIAGLEADAMLASYVLDPSRGSHELADLARDVLGHAMAPPPSGAKDGRDQLSVDTLAEIAGEHAEATAAIAPRLTERAGDDPELRRLLLQVELPLSRILAQMELRGCLVDVAVLHELGDELGAELRQLEHSIQQQAGWPVNINSPKQLQKLLFEQLGLSTGRKTKTGFSTDADVLADLAIEHPIAAQIDEYRGMAKLKSGYLDALPALVCKSTGRVHTLYNQAITATGRLSSSEPNLQNIPVRSEVGRRIRSAFIAPEGRVLLSADYSQVELRVLAHLSRDPVLIDAFERGQDVHLRTAAEVFDVDPDAVSPEQRRVAKAVNFGVIYGQTDWGLARQLRIPKHQAKAYIEQYFARYAGVQELMEQTIARAREERMVRTLLGRRRPLPEINARRWAARSYAERIARNTPIQGTAADLIKLAMIAVERELSAAKLDARMILSVHDELVFEVPPAQCEETAELVRAAMIGVMDLDVPLVVDTGSGRSWSEAH